MPLFVGTRLGPYEILAPLGAGGMGEVYRAKDTKLDREVAIKILPEAFAQDPERLARFEREAKVLAALNHPNIAQIYGVEERALVMELVEGETLKGPVPIETALNYATQMAEALEAAHDKGITHRDLKPSNVMITREGVVKVLDFGLAAQSREHEGDSTLTMSPTRAGMIMGTVAYMSPEQARGQVADRRVDIWAFGAVLYELLTGKQAFTGESVADTLATVLKHDPDWDALPVSAPASIKKLVRRCLTKDRKQRLQAIGEARIVLENPGGTEVPRQAEGPPHTKLLWPGVTAVLMLVAVALAFIHFREPPPAAPQVLQYTIDAPPKTRIANFAVSPDGRSVAMITTGARGGQMWVRPLDSLQPLALAGTEGATYPFWSPDSRYIGFFAGGKLKKISMAGGPVQTLCDAPSAGGGTWNPENVIVFGLLNAGLQRVSGGGGVPSKLQTNGFSPTFLPDGRRFLYGGVVGKEAGVYVGSLDEKPDSKARQRIVPDRTNAQYLPPSEGSPHGYILFVREQTLMAQPVDPNSLQPAGDVFPVIEQVSSFFSYFLYSVSRNGIILHLPGSTNLRQNAIFDRSGKQVAAIGGPVSTQGRVALSPDEKRMVSERGIGTKLDLWITELERGTESRFTFDASVNAAPIWSPDGSSVAFASARGGGNTNLYRKAANQAGQDELLFKSEFPDLPTDWSHDGRFIIFRQTSPQSGYDLFALPISGDKKPIPLLTSEFNEIDGTVSPDGRWLAYASDESGSYEVYVQPFAPGSPKPSSGKWQISIGGGRDPHWRGDGREMFYVAPDRKMMAVAVRTDGDSFAPQTPQALFDARFFTDGTLSRYAVSADGKRFLMAADPEAASESPPLHVTVNWLAGIKK